MENEDYEVQETHNRKGRDWNSKNFQVSGYGYPPEKLKAWNALRSRMPSWEELHKKYEN